MSKENIKKLMFDFFDKYINESDCKVKKNSRLILPSHCNPEGYFILHKDKYPWNKWDLEELKYHLETRAVDNPQPDLMNDLNDFCRSCTEKGINSAADEEGYLKDSLKPSDDDDEYVRGNLRKKRRSKKRRSKKKKSRKNSKRRKHTKRRR